MKSSLTVFALLASISAIAQDKSCDSLPVGGSFTVNTSDKASISTVEQKYTLVRSALDVYDLYLNLEFKDLKTKKPMDVLQEKNYREKLQRCYQQISPKLRDELNRKIVLHLYDPEIDVNVPVPPSVKIAMDTNPNGRADSRMYKLTMSCGTAVHEALHLTGLIDEYKEEWQKFNPNPFARVFGNPYEDDLRAKKPIYDCRSTGPSSSVMGDHNNALYFQHVLYSGHVNLILYPKCKSINSLYSTCVQNSYKTSKENGSLFGCKQVPQVCKTTDWVKAPKDLILPD